MPDIADSNIKKLSASTDPNNSILGPNNSILGS